MPRTKDSRPNWDDPSGVETASPEQRLLAAIIRLAVVDARAGDVEAALWLHNAAPVWLAYITPKHVDPDDIHNRLLRIAGCPVRV